MNIVQIDIDKLIPYARNSRTHSDAQVAQIAASGFGVALATQIIVFPWFGLAVTLIDQIGIALIFTAVSIIRSYAVRRLFNAIT